MTDNVSTALIDRSRGQEFTARVQSVFDAVAHWRSNISLAMTAPGVDQHEFDLLHFEIVECAKLLRRLDKAGERMRAVREGGPWPKL